MPSTAALRLVDVTAGGGGGAPGSGSAASAGAAPRTGVAGVLHRLFVPAVDDLPPEYVRFQILDSLQAACSYLRGVLTLHSTLTGAGVLDAASGGAAGGDAGAAAVSAVLALVLKDGSGHVGSLLAAYWLSARLDHETKYWRLAADVANDFGLTLELLAPLGGPRYFLGLTCAANVCKALCGVAAGGTRVAISQHFAGRSGAVAEVAAKEGAQETAVTLVGLALGFLCARTLNSSRALQWGAFAALTLVHVAANYAAVAALRLASVNRSRAYLLADAFVHDGLPAARRAAAAEASVVAQLVAAYERSSSGGGGGDAAPPLSAHAKAARRRSFAGGAAAAPPAATAAAPGAPGTAAAPALPPLRLTGLANSGEQMYASSGSSGGLAPSGGSVAASGSSRFRRSPRSNSACSPCSAPVSPDTPLMRSYAYSASSSSGSCMYLASPTGSSGRPSS